MSVAVRQRVALAFTAATGLLVLAVAGVLTTDALTAYFRLPQEEARVKELLARVQDDAAFAGPLQQELDRQAQASLVRQNRGARFGRLLIASAAGFLLSAKWLVRLGRTGVAVPQQILELRLSALAPPAATARSQAGAARALPVAEAVDVSVVDELVERVGRGKDAAIPVLQAIQAHYRYLPAAALRRVCELTEITPAQLVSVATFYTQFRRTPVGEHLVKVCCGTACHVGGSGRILDELRRHLGIAADADTDAQRRVTLEPVPCLGCCTLAPVVQIDGVAHGHARPDGATQLVRQALTPGRNGARRGRKPAAQPSGTPVGEIRIGLGSCCIANGSERTYDALREALGDAGINAVVKRVGCVGMCHNTPFVEVIACTGASPGATRGDRAGAVTTLYTRVQPEHARAIVRRHFRPPSLVQRLRNSAATAIERLRDGAARRAVAERVIELRDPPVAAFLGRQKRIATEFCGDLDPLDLDEYVAHDGFRALTHCLRELTPEQVVEQMRDSGLRGRGGAGYPAWRKWRAVRDARPAGGPAAKYVICNGDEGDPGAFMDRMLMESYPYRIIEGLAIAACAVGAAEGFFYIRAEYLLAVQRITEAIRRCAERGLLGDNALGGGRALRLRVFHGAGAFVCGEETALIASLEGEHGWPRLRPPYPAEQGLWGRPTLVGNVETYAVVPWILRNGPDAFARLGTPTSKGTKVFALAGKVQRGGLIEVPMGVTIREIVEEIGGGVRQNSRPAAAPRHRFKAVQIGGPSGGCVPAELADTPIDFDALAAVGAMMGSGGLVVLDETDCTVDIARYFLAFTQDQSCGKCVPCRVGTKRMLEIMDRLCGGQGQPGDLDKLEHLGRMVGAGSLCGLGKTAPNPVLTTLRYFRGEYEAHLAGRCPAGKCKPLIRYVVTDACTGCTLCAQHCPADAIPLRPYEKHAIDVDKCTRCDICRTWCPEDAIEVV